MNKCDEKRNDRFDDRHYDEGFACDLFPCFIEEQKRLSTEEKAALEKIDARIESREIIGQKAWKFIKKLNSYSEKRLDSVAIVGGKREYTYRQMFLTVRCFANGSAMLKFFGAWNRRIEPFQGGVGLRLTVSVTACFIYGADVLDTGTLPCHGEVHLCIFDIQPGQQRFLYIQLLNQKSGPELVSVGFAYAKFLCKICGH